MFRTDENTIIAAGSNSIQIDYAPVYALETSVSGLTAAESSALADIKAKTDSLTFTQAGNVDANIKYVNDVEVAGTGADGDTWGPA